MLINDKSPCGNKLWYVYCIIYFISTKYFLRPDKMDIILTLCIIFWHKLYLKRFSRNRLLKIRDFASIKILISITGLFNNIMNNKLILCLLL